MEEKNENKKDKKNDFDAAYCVDDDPVHYRHGAYDVCRKRDDRNAASTC